MALTDAFVRNSKHSGKANGDQHTDGGGMYLLVNSVGKYWRMDYRFGGKRKTLALGVYPAVSLGKARAKRDAARALLADERDPSVVKREAKLAIEATAANTFEAVARQWLSKYGLTRAAATNDKQRRWLEKDVFPYIGKLSMSTLGPRDVLGVLRKIEAREARDSAHSVKQLCGQVCRFAVASGLAERDVTADLRGALAPANRAHFAAITEPSEAGALMRSIYAYQGHPCTIAALKLAPLLFVRPGELRTAEWSEIDLDASEWRIPGTKMKMKQAHIVPLSTQAAAILRSLHPITGHGQYVFPSLRTGERPMSENTINAALRGMGYSKEVHSAHGFRAMARTILDQVLEVRVDLIEHQLAHAVIDPNGRAYNRTSHMPARRAMMQRWADYLDKQRMGADVIPLRAAS